MRIILFLCLNISLAKSAPVPALASGAASQEIPQIWRYTLLDGSSLTDDCLICGRPAIVLPLRGTFDLRRVGENPLFTFYAVENVAFSTGAPGAAQYVLTGQGEYRIGGEVALTQDLFLDLRIDDGSTNRVAQFTNATQMVSRLWPGIQTHADQTNGTPLQMFQLDLAAAPLQDIWFSSVNSMTPTIEPSPWPRISPGDLLSFRGQMVKSNSALTQALGIMPVVPDLGLDAVDLLPGGEIAFSLDQDIVSETLGALHHGDILSSQGRILHGYQDLIGAFSPMLPLPDVGLDALQIPGQDEVYFSIEESIFSQRLGVTLQPGDLLSSRGLIVRTEKELLSRFHPRTDGGAGAAVIGLDAVYLWPSGEIWFSTEQGFQDDQLGPILAGDLLSDQGYVVFRNLDLVSAFAPLEDLADFGLDALFLITDTTPPAPPPQITHFQWQRPEGRLRLDWTGAGRVFQVERAPAAAGPYQPSSLFLPDLWFEETTISETAPALFYRLRQW